ncbi:MAG TPA: NUDIX domain-containing protein, partial [Dehalococcoidia bacterium]|nr:NUDIX domain-containing protein [Dehalococcoidia bacterium]
RRVTRCLYTCCMKLEPGARTIEKRAGRQAVAVAVVIFTVREGRLSVLLIHRAAEPFAGRWALPGGLLLPGETLDQAAARKLTGETGVSDVYLEQLYTFDLPPGCGGPRAVVAYFALVDEAQVRLESRTTWQPAWYPVSGVPALAFDNNAIVEYALRRLQAKLSYSNVVYALLPERFTLTQLQRVYEAILERPLDKRNFRKRIQSLELVEPTQQVERSGAHRPARLYRFARREPLTF